MESFVNSIVVSRVKREIKPRIVFIVIDFVFKLPCLYDLVRKDIKPVFVESKFCS